MSHLKNPLVPRMPTTGWEASKSPPGVVQALVPSQVVHEAPSLLPVPSEKERVNGNNVMERPAVWLLNT